MIFYLLNIYLFEYKIAVLTNFMRCLYSFGEYKIYNFNEKKGVQRWGSKSPGAKLLRFCFARVTCIHITASLHCWSHLEQYYRVYALLKSSGAILLRLCITGVTWSNTTTSLNYWSHLEPYYSVSTLLESSDAIL